MGNIKQINIKIRYLTFASTDGNKSVLEKVHKNLRLKIKLKEIPLKKVSLKKISRKSNLIQMIIYL